MLQGKAENHFLSTFLSPDTLAKSLVPSMSIFDGAAAKNLSHPLNLDRSQ